MTESLPHRPRYVPSSTYRLQVYGGFTLHDAAAIVPYLGQLGIGAAHMSPYFAAQPGSTHGYDVSNHNELNVEVGGSDAHTAFTDALREHDLQHIVDFVPNHMGIATSTNPWWRDVLENGPSARAGRFFDIDWFPVKRELRRKLLLPILGDQVRPRPRAGRIADRVPRRAAGPEVFRPRASGQPAPGAAGVPGRARRPDRTSWSGQP